MKSSRIKNFCEICRKQCKDENGFHCHLNSAHHQKKIRQFATNPQQHIDQYSKELENKIIQILKVKYPGEVKDVEEIYEEYREDKYHIKFSYTHWKNLSEFVQYLKENVKNIKVTGKIPNCKIKYTISRTNDFLTRKKEQVRSFKQQHGKEGQEKQFQKTVQKRKQVEEKMFQKMEQKLRKQQDQQEYHGDNFQIQFQVDENIGAKRDPLFNVAQLENQDKSDNQCKKKGNSFLPPIQTKKNQTNTDDSQDFQWIMKDIIVKILPHQIPQPFHNKKASILQIVEPYVAQLKVGNATIQIDQAYLETVIPKPGNKVQIVWGERRGSDGMLKEIDMEKGIGFIQVGSRTYEYSFNEFSKLS